jgi:hypothetical protein
MKILKRAFLVLCFLLDACAPSIPSYVRDLMITTNDVPSGWAHQGENITDEWGGTKYTIGFGYGNDVTDPAIGHQLIVYSDKPSAIKGYEEYKNWIFTEIWVKPNEASFKPSNPGDIFEYRCDSLIINGEPLMDCLILQQHGSYVSAIDVRLGVPLTFDSLNSILKSIDEKMNKGE